MFDKVQRVLQLGAYSHKQQVWQCLEKLLPMDTQTRLEYLKSYDGFISNDRVTWNPAYSYELEYPAANWINKVTRRVFYEVLRRLAASLITEKQARLSTEDVLGLMGGRIFTALVPESMYEEWVQYLFQVIHSQPLGEQLDVVASLARHKETPCLMPLQLLSLVLRQRIVTDIDLNYMPGIIDSVLLRHKGGVSDAPPNIALTFVKLLRPFLKDA